MLAMFSPGGFGFFFLVVTVVTLCLFVVLVAGIVAIVYFIVKRTKTPPPPAPVAPVPAAPASPLPTQAVPVATKTEVMSRKCPQCGAALLPDAPEGLCPACLLQRGFATEAGPAAGQSAFVPPPISELAQLFPQLEIQECLGRGGMGAVYKARQPRLDRFVALKILAPEKQNDPQFAERFEREARALARLNHPNIVTVFDFGEVQGRFYLLMEFVDGLTLRQVMQAGKISPAEALNLVPKICEALQYAHEQGIIHRDIKPENILLDKQGRVKIADFGIAKIAGVEAKGLSLTGARDVMGTPNYMAPEQVEKPQTVDHRADIYSLGVVFYEMLTGELPLGKFAPPSQKVQMDVRLDEVVLHALEKEPARRYQHASQVKTAVETIAGTPPPVGAGLAAAAATAPPTLPGAVVPDASDKIILPAFLLAFFFGVFGAHRFYVGKIGTALLQLFTCGGFGIWATIDWILLVCGVFTDSGGRRMTNWIHPGPSPARPAAPTARGGNATPPGTLQPNRFWRNFAMIAGCAVLIPITIVILATLLFILRTGSSHTTATGGPSPQLPVAGLRLENGEYWTNFSQTFPLNADGQFSIDNVNGRIEIRGWNSNAVLVTTAIHGQTPESVNAIKVNIDAAPNHVAVHTEQPANNNNFLSFSSFWEWFTNHVQDKATVDYTIQAPEHASLDEVSSVNGRIDIAGVAGDITASTVNGHTQVRDAGHNLKLSTVNGHISAEMNSLGGGQSVALDAVNGELDLAVPEDAEATFSVSTVNGGITSEFPSLQAKKEFPVGNNLNGSLGRGGATVKAETVNGAVKILKLPAKQILPAAAPSSSLPAAGTAEAPATAVLTATNSSGPAVKEQAVSEAQSWLKLVDVGNYADSWKQAADIFQRAVTEAAWQNSMETFRQPLGEVVSRKLKSAQRMTELPGAPDGQYVVMQFDTSFANKSAAVETVTFDLEKDGQWKSSGYFIK
jgi:tRNA A-37 threonylcarbamoyl transferase component Bud32